MDRGSWLLAAVTLALVLVGGVAYVTLPDQNTDSTTGTLDASPADGTATANETVAFEALSPDQQALFERASNSTGAVDIPSDVSRDPFVDYRYVRYQNRTYEVAVAVP
jgi:hypothetical protein